MTIIQLPRRLRRSQKAVADFKRVCDDVGLELREDEVEAFLDQVWADLGGLLPPEPPPTKDI